MTPTESHYYRNDFEFLNSEFLNNKAISLARWFFVGAGYLNFLGRIYHNTQSSTHNCDIG